MPRLIDANALDWSKIEEEFGRRSAEVIAFEILIETAPTVDAEPVKHGKWLNADDGIGCTCSICGYDAWADTPFCPNCGAKMNGVTDAEIH